MNDEQRTTEALQRQAREWRAEANVKPSGDTAALKQQVEEARAKLARQRPSWLKRLGATLKRAVGRKLGDSQDFPILEKVPWWRRRAARKALCQTVPGLAFYEEAARKSNARCDEILAEARAKRETSPVEEWGGLLGEAQEKVYAAHHAFYEDAQRKTAAAWMDRGRRRDALR